MQGSPADADSSALPALNTEICELIVSYLSGAELASVEAAIPDWHHAVFSRESWWATQCQLQFRGACDGKGCWSRSWRRRYQQLHMHASSPEYGTWCYTSVRHNLGDRVAQPQLFLSQDGKSLFCYGGWTDNGPETDLHYVSLKDVFKKCTADVQQWSFSDEEGSAAAAGAESPGDFAFELVEDFGRPCYPGGVQSLTPLWFGDDSPSAAHIEKTYEQLKSQASRSSCPELSSNGRTSLVLAFGGAQGGYRNEHNRHAVGALQQDVRDDGATFSILWGKPAAPVPKPNEALPTPRAAHTATYVPSRLLASADYPEGVVVVFGGHTDDTNTELSSIEILNVQDWSWNAMDAFGDRPRPRHGHSATLVEVDGRGYLVIVGGGEGNILHGSSMEMGDVVVLDCHDWRWLGSLEMCWLDAEAQTGVPRQGRHHTASPGLNGEIYLFGGGHRPKRTVRLLNGRDCVEAVRNGKDNITITEISAQERGVQQTQADSSSGGFAAPGPQADPAWQAARMLPKGRKMHGAVSLLPYAPCLLAFGGWESGPHFEDLWIMGFGRSKGALAAFSALSRAQQAENDSEADGIEDFFHGVTFRGMGVPDTGNLRRNLMLLMLQNYQRQQRMQQEAGGMDVDSDEEGFEVELQDDALLGEHEPADSDDEASDDSSDMEAAHMAPL
mmetsp:Transcript_31332/g.73054  ORF Transcript_31332/g.73054 Transcript_31332/m.73054 type:complete len:670 (-) Transcript_31332:205-2214(-)|eukprot:CAMPEP_0178403920 /NCGR_PEP_ID=MMETSP0689_2-20121128/17616_1 /TAXON_ID=160604 /ORGANISM="Amphidinium massartii, Strain CS-259" /LENGTH=669 /DNA_ID=CAMNT_0020024887 /DNA_START=62 /DNA_END=2071 /DNA_ORIENTATION=+